MLILNFTNFTFLTDSMAKNITKIFTFLLSTPVLFTWTANFVPADSPFGVIDHFTNFLNSFSSIKGLGTKYEGVGFGFSFTLNKIQRD